MKFLILVCSLLLGVGCATTAPQSQEILHSPPQVAKAAEIKNVPFVDQDTGECGPASLTMAMLWAGHEVTVDQISPKVMTPSKKGSLQEDLVSACRREGMMGVRLEGMKALLEEVNAGHPVIIFENLGLSWYQQWHYAVVVGYDLHREELIMHSGHHAFERTDMRVFERSWKLSDYWGLVVLKPGDLAASSDELANLAAAAGLEKAGHDREAKLSYLAILRRWPVSLGALVGLGNLAYKESDYLLAVSYLRAASKAFPENGMVAHNLRVAEAKVEPSRQSK